MLFAIQASADKKSVQLDVFDRIGESFFNEDAVSAKKVRHSLKGVAPDAEIRMSINSRGGDVIDGLAIFNMLSAHPGRVTAHVTGLAASMASAIAMAADEIVIEKRAFMMIHNPFAGASGDAADLRSAADGLEAMQNQLAGIYADRTRQKKSEVLAMMAKETWLSSSEAVRLGFADRAIPSKTRAKAELKFVAEASADWESAPDEVRKSVLAGCATVDEEHDISVEIVAEQQEDMDPKELLEQITALLDSKLQPLAQRLDKLETPAQAEVDVAAQAAAQQFSLARNTALELAISEGKLPNSAEARAFFTSEAKDEASLARVVAHYAGQKPIVATKRTPVEAPALEGKKYTEAQAKTCKAMGWDPEKLFAE